MKISMWLLTFIFGLLGTQTVRAQTYEAYYNQFLYSGVCPKPTETKFFDTLLSRKSPAITITDIGEILVPSIDLQLFADGTYFADYTESFWQFGGHFATNTSRDGKLKGVNKTFTGNWKVKGYQIVVDGIGVGEGGLESGKPSIYLIFNTEIGTTGLIGKEIQFVKGQTNQGPKNACN